MAQPGSARCRPLSVHFWQNFFLSWRRLLLSVQSPLSPRPLACLWSCLLTARLAPYKIWRAVRPSDDHKLWGPQGRAGWLWRLANIMLYSWVFQELFDLATTIIVKCLNFLGLPSNGRSLQFQTYFDYSCLIRHHGKWALKDITLYFFLFTEFHKQLDLQPCPKKRR